MHRKNHLISALIFLVAGATWANSAFAWTAYIEAQGEVVGVDTNKSDVTIGVEEVAEREPSPPADPDYSVKMDLMNRPNDGDPDDDYDDYDLLKKDIRQAVGGAATHMWILQIDPNGNAGPFDRTSTISWDSAEFGSGDFEMKLGFDGTGPVVVADMTTTTSYDVTGTADTQFTIHFTPASQVCGDGDLEGTEECDDGAANGTATSCCKADCTFESAATSCDDGLFCTTGETCDGAGVCGNGTATDCSDGDDSIGGDGCFIETLFSGSKKNR